MSHVDFDDGRLFCADNLDVLRGLGEASATLIYLDPPFNTARDFGRFDDRWKWTPGDDTILTALGADGGPGAAASSVITALAPVLGRGADLAYLTFMAQRLVELHRVLRIDGSLYLHCDATMSHYLKVLLDAVFGRENFLNDVVWLYGLGGSSPRYWPRKHDDILWYSRTPMGQVFEASRIPATSHRMDGETKKAPDYWQIPALNNMAAERNGYPTQKPLALLERIVASSSRPGDVVLDPFCGSGTTLVAARSLGRRWIGIDVSSDAIELVTDRLSRVSVRA